MTTYTIDWSDNTSPPPAHSGLDTKNMKTILRGKGVLGMKEEILCSLDDVGLKANKRVHKWELNPMSYGKVELRNRAEVYIGWIKRENTNV